MGQFLRRLWQFVRPHQARLWMGLGSGLLNALANGLLLLVIKLIVDALFPPKEDGLVTKQLERIPEMLRGPIAHAWQSIQVNQDSKALVWLILLLPGTMALRGLGVFLNEYLMYWVGTFVMHDFRVRLFRHLQTLSLGYFSRTQTGDLVSRMILDMQTIQQVITTTFAAMAREPASAVVILGYLIWMQPKLSLIAVVVFPVIVVPILIFGRKVRRSWKASQALTADLSSLMQESFTGFRVVKAFNLESPLGERFGRTSRQIAGQFMRYIRASAAPGPVVEVTGIIGLSVLLYYVARYAKNEVTSGDFTSFLGALFSLYQPVKAISRLWGQLEQGRAAGERLFPLLDEQPGVPEPAAPVPIVAKGAPIEFQSVSFCYDDKPALKEFTLTIQPGQLVALVGASGSGKTTVTSLLLRFYDPDTGSVRIGGVDLRRANSHQLREQMAVVTQDTILFNDTIRNNIRYGRMDATDAEIEAAAKHAYADAFIRAKPGGYEEKVGERGSALSGGERQRITIARALLRNAPILVLDEATSALDTQSERAFQAALETLMQGRTTLCIAHRLSTIQKADVIIVMHEGRIVETGTHAELLAKGGAYRRLHDLQFQS